MMTGSRVTGKTELPLRTSSPDGRSEFPAQSPWRQSNRALFRAQNLNEVGLALQRR
jgi:hypothetical protein